MRAIRCKTNYRNNPLGIDDTQIRFSWNCEGGTRQEAFRVRCYSEEAELVWDSGRQETDRMHCIYGSDPPESRCRIYWKATLWDEKGVAEEEESVTAETVGKLPWFEMGLLTPEDFQAKWICGPGTDRKERLPADYFQKKFTVKGGIKRARLYVSACGVYTALINGVRLSGVMAPGTTEYEKRIYYQTYDVTGLLHAAGNSGMTKGTSAEENVACLEFHLGDGWYKGKLGFLNQTNRFGTQRLLLAQLEIVYENGRRQTVASDDSFLWSNDGPIRYADLKDGEVYDATRVPSYGTKAVVNSFGRIPTASCGEAIEEHEELSGRLLISPSGKRILDFGQNLAGYVKFSILGKRGQQITLKLREVLDHGECSNRTLLRSEKEPLDILQEIRFICSGEEDVFEPEFFYSGFRYAQVEGLDDLDERKAEHFRAVAVYTNLEFTGDFHCSNEKINQFHRCTLWSLKSNFVDVPTDCPQREKSGWDGDAQVFCETAAYLADTAAFFRKWSRDMRDCQRKDGRVANVSPSAHRFQDKEPMGGSVGWADAAIRIPYMLWKLYGDDRFITENYDLMHGWEQYVIRAASDKRFKRLSFIPPLNRMFRPYYVPKSPYEKYVIESGRHWGEWHDPGVDCIGEQIQPKPELTTAYLHISMEMLAQMLEQIGRGEEADLCREYAEGTKEAYQYYFVKDGTIQVPGKEPRQAPLVRSLALGLVDGMEERAVAETLREDVVKREYTVGTGFLSTPYILPVLADHGYLEEAYRMLENTKAPGWLAMVENGATSVWETYELCDENGHPLIHSLNHYSAGAVCGFLYRYVCGIRVEGENHFVIAPVPGGTLTHAEAVYLSPYGSVESRWERKEGNIIFTIVLPANTSAEICLPGKESVTVGAGRHIFEMAEA